MASNFGQSAPRTVRELRGVPITAASKPALVYRLGAGETSDPEPVDAAQLVVCYFGVLKLDVAGSTWYIPSKHGAIVPRGARITVTARNSAEVHHLMLGRNGERGEDPPLEPAVIVATPILRGVVQRLSGSGRTRFSEDEIQRLMDVAHDEIGRLETADLSLPGDQDPRLSAAMSILLDRPDIPRTLASLAFEVGSSERTLARLFSTETGITFSRWRRRHRFLIALEGIQRGTGSSELARKLGYSSSSAFITAFKAEFGCTPSSLHDAADRHSSP
ncbi:MAG: AraC family transcriptional regulator [Sagittula sp.]|uniref:AraC family transcriptional regulator n=1 Tax=Sagittula sp. TaxID=2038081 RepID=UPI004059983C